MLFINSSTSSSFWVGLVSLLLLVTLLGVGAKMDFISPAVSTQCFSFLLIYVRLEQYSFFLEFIDKS